MKPVAALLVAPLTLALGAAPALALSVAKPVYDPIHLGVEAQSVSGKGLMTGVTYAVNLDSLETGGRLIFYPQGFTKFFTGDYRIAFAPKLGGGLLPFTLQPIAGLEGGMYIDDFIAPAGGTGTANAYIAVPVGARATMGFGAISASIEGIYHFQAFDVLPAQYGYDTSRLRLEAGARMGDLAGGVFVEQGKFWSGPGLKLGLNF